MAKSNTKAYVRIQSSRNIRVTMGLNCQDVTNPDAHIPDRLKINPLWPKLSVLIKQGAGWYPSEIASWNTVKALVDDGILTIGEFSDTAEDTVVAEKEELVKKIEEVAKKGGVSLNEITED